MRKEDPSPAPFKSIAKLPLTLIGKMESKGLDAVPIKDNGKTLTDFNGSWIMSWVNTDEEKRREGKADNDCSSAHGCHELDGLTDMRAQSAILAAGKFLYTKIDDTR